MSIGTSGGGSQTSETKTEPWGPAQPYLKDLLSAGSDIYQQRLDAGPYSGSTYVGYNPTQMSAIQQMLQLGTEPGQRLAADAYGMAHSNAVEGANFGSNAAGIYAQAMGDPTQANITAAGQYANNPHLDGVIDAASRDVTRNLNETQLPTLNRNAVARGNTNSSRTGVAEGILMRGAQDRIGDISSSIRAAAYDKGLGLAESSRISNLGAALKANDSVGKAGAIGLDAGNRAYDYAATNVNNTLKAGSMYQQDEAARKADEVSRYYQNAGGYDLGVLQDFWNQALTAGQIGGTQTTTTTRNGGNNFLGNLMGLGMTAAGIYSGGVGNGAWGSLFGGASAPKTSMPMFSYGGYGGWDNPYDLF